MGKSFDKKCFCEFGKTEKIENLKSTIIGLNNEFLLYSTFAFPLEILQMSCTAQA